MPAPGTALYNDFSDAVGHGTMCAGVLGGVGNNGLGTAGISWAVNITSCKAASPSGILYLSSLTECYDLCRQARADSCLPACVLRRAGMRQENGLRAWHRLP